ncbi:hypothetical protein [uncultured Gammaproteobacteria bacterium]|nr:hypothetical protein [uncultured Gammaproteobacteria bacterium]
MLLVVLTILSFVFLGKNEPVRERTIAVDDCSIMQDTCHVKMGDLFSLSFDVSPKGLPPTKEAIVTVKSSSAQVNKIEVVFLAVDLDYSPPKIRLNKVSDKKFNGRIFLSLCTLKKTKWIANLMVYTDTDIWKIIFPFVHSGDRYNAINPSLSINK